MKQPIIFAIDDDPQVLRALTRDLRNHYKKDYRIISTESATEAINALKEFKSRNDVIALFVSDQRMPEMLGVDFLTEAKKLYPNAKRVLLTAYSDIEAAIRAINDVQLDYYLSKPWDPPEEKLIPVLDDLLFDWQSDYTPDFTGIRVVGYQFSPVSHEIKSFLSGNLIPYAWVEYPSDPKAEEWLQLSGKTVEDLPLVILESGEVLPHPSVADLGQKIGLKSQATQPMYDVVIVGAGPAGLASAVYGGSEGLKTLLIERKAPGGQAGTSSRIENYLGFPTGLSGADLTRRAITQATRFGVEFLAPVTIEKIELQEPYKILHLSDGSRINTKSIIISSGMEYRLMTAPGMDRFTGAGIYYGAARTEAHACKGQDVYIVGGGNSAGQAAMYLASHAKKVYIVIRRTDLSATMSQYLIDQIAGTPNIELIPCSEVIEAFGSDHLERITIQNMNDKSSMTVPLAALFIFIGTRPATDWLHQLLITDPKGFIETGRDVMRYPQFKPAWKQNREPYLLESNVAGIFVAGDARAGAMNRVAGAVGEGSMAIKYVHEYLATL